MTGYKSLDDILNERLQADLAEERTEPVNTCCSACRRGTRAHGNLPCGDPRCPCHQKGPR